MALSQSARSVARAVDEHTGLREQITGKLRSYGVDAGGGQRPDRASADSSDEKRAAAPAENDGMDPADFPATRDLAGSIATAMEQQTVPLDDAGEALTRSVQRGEDGEQVHVICPMVLPRGRSLVRMLPVLMLLVVGLIGTAVVFAVSSVTGGSVLTNPLFGIHYWILSVLAVAFVWWRQGLVMVPEGCQAMITRFGRLEQVVGAGRVILLNPWKRVSYIINTTREYPFNAPVREAPTKGGVKASIDLFIQFRINDPVEFVYTLGAVRGFEEKLGNAVSETIRSLIYEREAADIYNMVGEDTGRLLEQLNEQFRPAVELTNANITYAEPSDRAYRMDLAAPEMVRVAKEAYTHEYALQLQKEQDEGDLTKELATLGETLSAIQADIAQYQAQMDTAVERETNRAEALARQRYVQAESEAKANAALLEAQALDIRAVTAAEAPEILEYRHQQEILDTLEKVADHLPRLVRIGDSGGTAVVDFLQLARDMIGERGTELFTEADKATMRGRLEEVSARIAAREDEIAALRDAEEPAVPAPTDGAPTDGVPTDGAPTDGAPTDGVAEQATDTRKTRPADDPRHAVDQSEEVAQ